MRNRVLLLVSLLGLASATARVPAPAQVPTSTPSTLPAVAPWIEQLRADDWAAREEATSRLVQLGRDALPALQSALQAADDPETRSRLEAVIAQVEENDAVGASRITMKFDGASLDEVIAELGRQSRSSIEYERGAVFPNRNEAPAVTLELNDASFWEAIRAIEKAAGVQVVAQQRWQVVRDWGDGISDSPFTSEDGPFQFIATGTHYNRNRQYGRGAGQNESFGVQLVLRAEPKVYLAAGQLTMTIDRAVDDAGNELAPPGMSAELFAQQFGMVHSVVNLPSYPAKPGAKIAQLSGSVVVSVARRVETVTIEDVREMTPQRASIGDVPLLIERVDADPQFGADTRAVRFTLGPDASGSAQETLQAAIQGASVPQGGELPLVIRSWDTDRRADGGSVMTVTLGTHPGQPNAKLRLDLRIPQDFREVQTRFDFRDLPMP